MGGLSSVGIVTSYGTGRDRIITEQRARNLIRGQFQQIILLIDGRIKFDLMPTWLLKMGGKGGS